MYAHLVLGVPGILSDILTLHFFLFSHSFKFFSSIFYLDVISSVRKSTTGSHENFHHQVFISIYKCSGNPVY